MRFITAVIPTSRDATSFETGSYSYRIVIVGSLGW